MAHERIIESILGQEKCCKNKAKEIAEVPIEDIEAFFNGKSQLNAKELRILNKAIEFAKTGEIQYNSHHN